MTKHLFLDLEDTIITPVVNGWHDFELINVQKIRDVIDSFQPDEIDIFSFAIWNERELNLFNTHTRPAIELALRRPLQLIPTVDGEIIPACCEVLKINKTKVDFSDASDFWSKHESFRLFCRFIFSKTWKNWNIETEVVFLDDAVINEDFHFLDLRIKGKIRNIDDLQDI